MPVPRRCAGFTVHVTVLKTQTTPVFVFAHYRALLDLAGISNKKTKHITGQVPTKVLYNGDVPITYMDSEC